MCIGYVDIESRSCSILSDNQLSMSPGIIQLQISQKDSKTDESAASFEQNGEVCLLTMNMCNFQPYGPSRPVFAEILFREKAKKFSAQNNNFS